MDRGWKFDEAWGACKTIKLSFRPFVHWFPPFSISLHHHVYFPKDFFPKYNKLIYATSLILKINRFRNLPSRDFSRIHSASLLPSIYVHIRSVFRVVKGNLIIDDTGELHLREVNFIWRPINRISTGVPEQLSSGFGSNNYWPRKGRNASMYSSTHLWKIEICLKKRKTCILFRRIEFEERLTL